MKWTWKIHCLDKAALQAERWLCSKGQTEWGDNYSHSEMWWGLVSDENHSVRATLPSTNEPQSVVRGRELEHRAWNTDDSYTQHLSQTLCRESGEGHRQHRICYNCDNKFRPILDCRRQLLTLSVKGFYIFGKYLTDHRCLGFQATTHSHRSLQF
jgi:hypothetical protein